MYGSIIEVGHLPIW